MKQQWAWRTGDDTPMNRTPHCEAGKGPALRFGAVPQLPTRWHQGRAADAGCRLHQAGGWVLPPETRRWPRGPPAPPRVLPASGSRPFPFTVPWCTRRWWRHRG